MKQLTEKVWRTASNAWGRDVTSASQDFQIEPSDVGRRLPNHRGYRHAEHQVTKSDIGRVITVQTDGTEWTCWNF